MPFLVVDPRFGTPIYVFLEIDPRREADFPDIAVREVTLSPVAEVVGRPTRASGLGPTRAAAVGRDPHRLDQFTEFGSDRAVSGAGFILIEPRYVGPSWAAYQLAFRPEGQKPSKRSRSPAGIVRTGR